MYRTRKRKTKRDGKLLRKTAHQRRMRDDQHLLPIGMMIEGNAVLFNDAAHVIVVNQNFIPLTPIEYALLKLLLQQPGVAVSSEALIQVAFPVDASGSGADSRLLARHITNIRPKLWQMPLIIYAVNNFGYMLQLSEEQAHLPGKKRKDD